MRYLILIALLLSGCVSWQSTFNKTLHSINETTDGIEKLGLPVLNQQCKDAVNTCAQLCKADIENCKISPEIYTNCKTLTDCHKKRRHFATGLNSVRYGIIDANLGLQIATSKDSAYAKILQVVKLAEMLKAQLCSILKTEGKTWVLCNL